MIKIKKWKSSGIKTAALIILVLSGLYSCRTGMDEKPWNMDADIAAENAQKGVWLKGDFHAHSDYSDGDSTVADVIQFAENQNLTFFVLTDHDTKRTRERGAWDDESYASSKMLLLYGMEWTSGKGHANILSGAPFDYSEIWLKNTALDPEGARIAANEADALFSINHPNAPACIWRYPPDFRADAVEIWNGPFSLPNGNSKTVSGFWETILLSGIRLPAIGGSDSHHLKGFQKDYNPPGYPTTWVFAAKRDGRSLLDAVRGGRVSISYSPLGDRLEWSADGDGDGNFETMMGDVLPAAEKQSAVTFKARVVPGGHDGKKFHRRKYTLIIIKNGNVEKRQLIKPGRTDTVYYTDTPQGVCFYRAELRGSPKGGLIQKMVRGEVLAVTNPIYAGYAER